MKNTFTIIVVLHLLAHAVLGCCWHHAHALCQETGHEKSAVHETAIARSHGACSHGHHHGPSQGQSQGHDTSNQDSRRPDHPAPVDSCDGGKCHWLGKDTTEIDHSLESVNLISEIDLATCSSARLLESSLGEPPPDVSVASPPVRTHLLYQILMI